MTVYRVIVSNDSSKILEVIRGLGQMLDCAGMMGKSSKFITNQMD